MSSKRPPRHADEGLRRAAEKRLGRGPPRPAAAGGGSPADLLHELQVHQTELELQNEELLGARGALEEARDRYVELFDFAPVGYLMLDGAGKIASANLAAAALLGVDRAKLATRPFGRFVAAQDAQRWVSHLEKAKERDAPQACELLLRPDDREPFPVQLTTVRAALATDGSVGVRCTVVDITDRRRSEEERTRRIAELSELNQRLEQTQLQLLQADKLAAIGLLAAGVAHEVNNPLTYVMSNLFLMGGYLEELFDPRRGAPDAGAGEPLRGLDAVREDLSRGLAESLEGVERVSRVVKDLMAFAHRDTGRWQTAEVHGIIEGALRILVSGVGDGVRIVRAFSVESITLRCRPAQMGQVFLNVLVNAAQAAAPGGTVTIRTGRTGGEAWVEFEDSGTGIAPEHLDRLFEPFFTTKAVGAGTGLGLSIAHGIVRGHGGRIEVRSVLGAGSTFRIVVPIGGAEASHRKQEAAPGQ